MSIDKMWSKESELLFFKENKEIASNEQLFYVTGDNHYYAYWPNGYNGKKNTLQSRNSLIGNFTEKWTTNLIKDLVEENGYFVRQNVQCDEIGLNYRSPADIVISTSNKNKLKPDQIKMIFEVKMSLVWNWEFNVITNTLTEIGDFKTHQGTPSLLRSDSMLKAVGKCINIRISDIQSSSIPIIVIGNSPITSTYGDKVDHLKNSGVIQGVWSINPRPLNNEDTLKYTPNKGFIRFDNELELKNSILNLLSMDLNYFSGMITTNRLGQIIEESNLKPNYTEKGENFLKLLRSDDNGSYKN